MKPERSELAEGIFFNRIPIEKFKTAHLSIYFVTPLCDEAAASRIALLPAVLRRGSRLHPTAADLARCQEDLYSATLGASVFKTGDQQVLSFSISALRREFVPDGQDLLPDVAALLSEVVFDPILDPKSAVFLEEYVDGEKRNLVNRIRSIQNNKASYAAMRCASIMHAGEACGLHEYGTVEEVQKITPAALYSAYRTLLAEAHIEIFYAGTEAEERVLSCIKPALNRIRRYPHTLCMADVQAQRIRRKSVTERTEVSQARLCLGFRTGISYAHEDATVLALCNYVFAASPTSKLFVNVRERLSLCYSCSSSLSLGAGTLTVAAGLETSKRRRAIREIKLQLRKMRAGKITERELMMAKKTMAGLYLSLYDSPIALERWYLVRSLFGVDTDIESVLASIDSFGTDDVARVAKCIRLDTVYFLRAEKGSKAEEGEDDE